MHLTYIRNEGTAEHHQLPDVVRTCIPVSPLLLPTELTGRDAYIFRMRPVNCELEIEGHAFVIMTELIPP